jgi:ubiquinone/menaquinone biosynthesis C-methylase UbiE
LGSALDKASFLLVKSCGIKPSFESIPIAAVQDFWNSRPCNILHSAKPVGSKEYFDEVETRKYFVERHIPGFAEFEKWREKRVLEIGCGIGTDTMNFARSGATVMAVDLSEKSLVIARDRAKSLGLLDRITFVKADVERLDESLPIEQFDLIYSFGVLHHTPHPERAVAQLRQYAQPGSTLKVMVYHRWSWKVLAILMSELKMPFGQIDALIAQHSEAQTGCPVTYSYSKRSGIRLLAHCGFEVTNVQVEHIFPYKISDYARYRYKIVWYFRWLPTPLFRLLERQWGWHLCLTAKVGSAVS